MNWKWIALLIWLSIGLVLAWYDCQVSIYRSGKGWRKKRHIRPHRFICVTVCWGLMAVYYWLRRGLKYLAQRWR